MRDRESQYYPYHGSEIAPRPSYNAKDLPHAPKVERLTYEYPQVPSYPSELAQRPPAPGIQGPHPFQPPAFQQPPTPLQRPPAPGMSLPPLNDKTLDKRVSSKKNPSGKHSQLINRISAFFVIIGGTAIAIAMWLPWFDGYILGDHYSSKALSTHHINPITGNVGLYFIPWILFLLGISITVIALIWELYANAKFWATISILLSLIVLGLSVVGILNPLTIYTDFNYQSKDLKATTGVYVALIGAFLAVIGSVTGFILGRNNSETTN